MNGVTVKNFILIAISVIGGFFVDFVGGVDTILKALIIFMVVDYITGLMVAFIFHKSSKTKSGVASSKEGFKGIVKKMCILLLVGLSHELDLIMKVDYIRATTVIFFLANEGLSVLENVGLMDIRYPQFLKKALEVLKEKGDEVNE